MHDGHADPIKSEIKRVASPDSSGSPRPDDVTSTKVTPALSPRKYLAHMLFPELDLNHETRQKVLADIAREDKKYLLILHRVPSFPEFAPLCPFHSTPAHETAGNTPMPQFHLHKHFTFSVGKSFLEISSQSITLLWSPRPHTIFYCISRGLTVLLYI